MNSFTVINYTAMVNHSNLMAAVVTSKVNNRHKCYWVWIWSSTM